MLYSYYGWEDAFSGNSEIEDGESCCPTCGQPIEPASDREPPF